LDGEVFTGRGKTDKKVHKPANDEDRTGDKDIQLPTVAAGNNGQMETSRYRGLVTSTLDDKLGHRVKGGLGWERLTPGLSGREDGHLVSIQVLQGGQTTEVWGPYTIRIAKTGSLFSPMWEEGNAARAEKLEIVWPVGDGPDQEN